MSLSISGFLTYDQCPAKYDYSYNKRLPRGAQHPAATRGEDIHESIRRYMEGSTDDLHDEIRFRYGQWLMSIKQYQTLPELKFAVNHEWKICEWDSPECQWRGFIDLATEPEGGVIDIYEWKTGRPYDSHKLQAELYGVIALALRDTAEMSRVTTVYFDQPQNPPPLELQRKDFGGYKALWKSRYDTVMRDSFYPANPGWYCKYCSFSRANGGPCQF